MRYSIQMRLCSNEERSIRTWGLEYYTNESFQMNTILDEDLTLRANESYLNLYRAVSNL